MARSLGWNVRNTALLVPDFKDTETQIVAAHKRVMRDAPVRCPIMMRLFRSYVRRWIRCNLEPLKHDCDVSVETWLEHTQYEAWRKQQLLRARVDHLDKQHLRNKSFIKRESYRVPKHARWINSRTDAFKVATGPVFWRIEEQLYKHHSFIKKVPVAERAKYILDMMGGGGNSFIETDHTSFEAHFKPEVVKRCEFELYWYMTRNLPEYKTIRRNIKAIAEKQFCGNQWVAFQHFFARMSGDMCTSLGNGFTNLMIMSFLATMNGWTDLVGVVEGDDGLFVAGGVVPTEQQFEELGFRIKLVEHDDVTKAGFCGIFQAPGEPENLIDPAWALARSGWTMSKWLNAGPKKLDVLSRAKAFSLVCEAPANPITSELALWIIRATSAVKDLRIGLDEDAWWMRQCLSSNLSACIERARKGPTPAQRKFVHEQWNISPSDQIELESYFRRQRSIHEIDHPLATRIVCDAYPWCEFAHNRFSVSARVGTSWRAPIA